MKQIKSRAIELGQGTEFANLRCPKHHVLFKRCGDEYCETAIAPSWFPKLKKRQYVCPKCGIPLELIIYKWAKTNGFITDAEIKELEKVVHVIWE